jgi:hypothetical protein
MLVAFLKGGIHINTGKSATAMDRRLRASYLVYLLLVYFANFEKLALGRLSGWMSIRNCLILGGFSRFLVCEARLDGRDILSVQYRKRLPGFLTCYVSIFSHNGSPAEFTCILGL